MIPYFFSVANLKRQWSPREILHSHPNTLSYQSPPDATCTRTGWFCLRLPLLTHFYAVHDSYVFTFSLICAIIIEDSCCSVWSSWGWCSLSSVDPRLPLITITPVGTLIKVMAHKIPPGVITKNLMAIRIWWTESQIGLKPSLWLIWRKLPTWIYP